MTPEELARLDVLYRRTTVHLAQVATPDAGRGTDSILEPPDRGRPQHHLFTTGAFHVFGPAAFRGRRFRPLDRRTWRCAASAALLGGPWWPTLQLRTTRWWPMPCRCQAIRGCRFHPEQLRSVLASGRDQNGGEKFIFASFLFSHDLQVGLLALCTGILAGMPTSCCSTACSSASRHCADRGYLRRLLGLDLAAWRDRTLGHYPLRRRRLAAGHGRARAQAS